MVLIVSEWTSSQLACLGFGKQSSSSHNPPTSWMLARHSCKFATLGVILHTISADTRLGELSGIVSTTRGIAIRVHKSHVFYSTALVETQRPGRVRGVNLADLAQPSEPFGWTARGADMDKQWQCHTTLEDRHLRIGCSRSNASHSPYIVFKAFLFCSCNSLSHDLQLDFYCRLQRTCRHSSNVVSARPSKVHLTTNT